MPFETRLFVKTSMVYFILGVLIGGGGMILRGLTGQALSYHWVLIHTHFLTVGWITQMIMGVALWMFPRYHKPPYKAVTVWWIYGLMNGGLLLRALSEPATFSPGSPLGILLAVSGLAQILGVILFILSLWRRVSTWKKEFPDAP
ncbi:MAG: hypothetical protein HYU64_10990 [Armatimonadetes bacterium]|nr:hypothetical protein [Armatimonadota bacterium]